MKSARYDITNALIHLTGDRSQNGGLIAEEALCAILREREIKGSSYSGFIKGGHSAACLTDMPLKAARILLSEHEGKKVFSSYGIAMSKKTGWKCGARPVIYLPESEASWIPRGEKWRHVTYEIGEVDWTHEREWRAKGNMSITKNSVYAIVPNRDAELRIRKKLKDEELDWVLGFLHLEYINDLL